MPIELSALCVRPVIKSEEARYRELMQQHHYLGDLAKIGHTLWYVATQGEEWAALLSFSASAWKCGARDRWIGWDFRHQFDRLSLIANNSRFLILPEWHTPNLGSKVLSLCHQRIASDWQVRFGQPLLLMETFVDPARFHGTVYRAANWTCLGLTQGFRRTREGYSASAESPKLIFVRPLRHDARAQLSRPILDPLYRTGVPQIMLTAQQMRTLPDFFQDIPDPRRAEGRRHRLCVCWASRPAQPYAACVATRPSPNGQKTSAPRPENASVVAANKNAMSFRVNRSSVTCWSVLIPSNSTTPCNSGMRPSVRKTEALRSTERRCATRSTNRDGKLTS